MRENKRKKGERKCYREGSLMVKDSVEEIRKREISDEENWK